MKTHNVEKLLIVSSTGPTLPWSIHSCATFKTPKNKQIGPLSKKLKVVNFMHSTDRVRDGSFNLMMNNVESYIKDNRNTNSAFETNIFQLEYCNAKIFTCSSHLEQIAMSFLNNNSAIILAVVMDKLFHQNIKGSTNFQRIEKRNFGVIP
jgi:hypothetical protein